MPARTVLLPLLALAGCAPAAKRAAAPLPTATPVVTGWLHPERRGSIVEATSPAQGFLFPGLALVDTAGNRVFVTGSNGAIDAVELPTGRALFRGAGPGAAIRLLGGGALAAITPDTRLTLVDANDGTELFVSLPTGTQAENVERVYAGKETLRVTWKEVIGPRGGAPFVPYTNEGAFTVSLRDGTVTKEPTAVRKPGGGVVVTPFDVTLEGHRFTLEAGASGVDGLRTWWKRALVVRSGTTIVWSHPLPPIERTLNRLP
jgi:hypothetical protein